MSGLIGRVLASNSQSNRRNMSRLMVTSALVAVGSLALAGASSAADYELPTGGSVTRGTATITNPTVDKMNVNQTSSRVVINWNSFNIGTDATVQFYQPSATSLAVNKVSNDGQFSRINGHLTANGKVVILDPNGIIFGKDSVINVGAILASTGDLDNDRIMAGDKVLQLTNFGDASVENLGSITAANAGLVALVAPTVKNSGIINAKLGYVSLAAGNSTATVDLYGDGLVELAYTDKDTNLLSENTGTIDAVGRKVQMTAAAAKDMVDSVVNMDGVINATDATYKNGKIILSAKTVNVKGAATGNTTVTAKTANLGSTVNGALSGSAQTVNVLSDSAKIAQGLTIVDAGGTVNVGAGNYNEHLVINKAGVTLNGAKAGVSGSDVSRGAGETVVVPNSPGVTIAANGVTVDGFTFTGATGADGYGVYVNGANNATVKNNVITNTSQSGVYVLNGTGATISGNSIGVGAGAGNIQGDGIRLVRGSGATISGNTIANTNPLGVGYGSGVYATLSDNLQITGNTISDNVWDGVKLGFSNNALIDGNTFGSITRAAFSIAGSIGTTISNNIVNSAGLWGVWNYENNGTKVLNNTFSNISNGYGVESVGGSNLLVDGNGFDNIKFQGVRIQNSTGTNKVSDNTINNTGDHGIYVVGTSGLNIFANAIGTLGGAGNIKGDGVRIITSNGAVLQRNTITNTKPTGGGYGSGIYSLFSDNVVIGGTEAGNHIYGTKWDGIKVEGGNNVSVLANNIHDVGRAGVAISKTTNSIVDSVGTILNSGVWGIWSTRNNGLTIQSTTVDGTGTGEGIYSLGDSDLLIDHMTVRNTATNGIYVESAVTPSSITETPAPALVPPVASVTISNSDIKNTGAHGIYVLSSDNVDILNNTIGTTGGSANIKGDGIRAVYANGLLVNGNSIANTIPAGNGYGSGVYVNYSNNVDVTNNTIHTTKWDGVKVGFGDSYFVGNNFIYDITRAGVSANDTTNSTIIGNDIFNTGRWGVWSVNNDGISVDLNTMSNIAREGIYSDNDSNADFSFNDISNVGTDGIHAININGNMDIIGNTITGVGHDGIYVQGSGSVVILLKAMAAAMTSEGSLAPYVTIDGNIISNTYFTKEALSGAAPSLGLAHAGIEIDVGQNGYAAVSGNTIGNNFMYGLYGTTGEIDLTGAANTIHNTNIGMGFYPVSPYSYPIDGPQPLFIGDLPSLGSVLRLTGDTIGSTQFIDQSVAFVDLGYGAFFYPGTPTLLNGMSATYTTSGVTIDPSLLGGMVTPSDAAYLESMFYHYVDSNDRGLFSFPIFVPGPTPLTTSYNTKDALRFFSFPLGGSASGSLMVTGLPRVGGRGAPAGAPAGGAPSFQTAQAGGAFDPNAIEPAAGDETAGNTDNGNAQNVADIQPAAGEGNASSCWSDATQVLSQGSAVTFNLGGGASALLQDAANCGNANANPQGQNL